MSQFAKQVQRRRGTTAEHKVFTGVAGEITIDSTKNTVVVHDGVTQGGHPLAKEADLEVKANKEDLNAFRRTEQPITKGDLDQTLVEEIEGSKYNDTTIKSQIEQLSTQKADRSELENYRLESEPIQLTDLDQTVKDAISSGYDDTPLKTSIQKLTTEKADKTELEDYRKKSAPIVESDLSSELQAKVNATGSGSVDTSNFRLKSELIEVADLSASVMDTINSKAYNDSEIRGLLGDKANTSDLADYFHKTNDLVTEEMLVEAVRNKLNSISSGTGSEYNDTELRNLIKTLQDTKISTTDADSKYRSKTVQITIDDLALDIATKISTIDEKADKTELANYRLKSQFIVLDDLDDTLATTISMKLDKDEAATTYRKKADLLAETDLTQEVRNKLNGVTGGSGYDDAEVRELIAANTAKFAEYRPIATKLVEEDLDEAVKTKLNSEYNDTEVKGLIAANTAKFNDYRDKATKILETDLDEAVKTKLNAVAYDDTEVRGLISANTAKFDEYRDKATKLAETDLDEAVKTKLNKEYNDTEVRGLISANTAKFADYRDKATKLLETDLDETVVTKLNKEYNDTEIKSNIADLTGRMTAAEEDLLNMVTSDTLTNYRLKVEKIDSTDLNPTLADKITNAVSASDVQSAITGKLDVSAFSHNTITDKNGDESFLHITKAEKDKFLAYETTIAELIKRIEALEAGGGSTTPEVKEVEWEFTFDAGVSNVYYLKNLPNFNSETMSISDEDWYGPNYDSDDFTGNIVEMYFLGPTGNQQEPVLMPRNVDRLYPVDPENVPELVEPYGEVEYDSTPGTSCFRFTKGGTTDYTFKVVKYKQK